MIVLGVESSCDETAAALVRDDGVVLSDVVSSQIAVHAPYGGVVPELASRAHLRAIVPTLRGALAPLQATDRDDPWRRVDGIAVTRGPGLVGALLVGIEAAKAIAAARGLPIVGVSHLHGHLHAARLVREPGRPSPSFPFVALLVSGGHTALYRVDDDDRHVLLGQTRDDAAGEAFDKVAKLLGLGYPGGPAIDRLAMHGDPRAVKYPRPMAGSGTLELSFSGLKTAVAQHVRKLGDALDERGLADVAASFQRVVVETLVAKSLEACAREGVGRLVMTGGVAANRGLRALATSSCAARGVELHLPDAASCTDNAAMIAFVGARRLARGERDDPRALAPFSRDVDRRRGKF